MSATPVAAISGPSAIASTPHSKYQQSLTIACIMLGDFLTIGLLFGLVVVGRHVVTHTYHLTSFFEFFPFMAMIVMGFWIQGLYPGVLLHPAEEMHRIFVTIATVFLMLTCTTFFWRNGEAYSRAVILIAWSAGTPMVLLSRYLLRNACASKGWWGIPAIVFGSGPAAQRIIRTLQTGRRGVRVAGVMYENHNTAWPEDLPPLIGPISRAPAMARTHSYKYAILALPEKGKSELHYLIQDCCSGFSHVLLVPDLPRLCSLGVVVRELDGEVALELPQRLFHKSASLAKRLTDLAVGTFATVLLLPLFIAVAIAVRISSAGPALYTQPRYGRDGRIFKALKFRTMIQNADSVLATYLDKHPEISLEWERNHKLKYDPRITTVGKWLRRFSLDELPQLLNVLAGQMSLVGPRPIVQSEIKRYGRGYSLYSRVNPGITGLWQVSGRNNTTYDERVAFDEFYVRNWSVWLDLYILVRTIKTVITAEGAY